MLNVLEEIETLEDNVEVIVIHSMTNNLKDNSMENIAEMVSNATDKSLFKATKVVLSTIVNRDDDILLSTKAAAVNANIKVKFINHLHISICSNDNLRE